LGLGLKAVTVTLDPGFLWSIGSLLFMAGAGWASLHLSVRWIERKQDAKLDAIKEVLALEIQTIKNAHEAHVERYEKEHGELKSKVDNKGESVTTLIERMSQVEKRLDEKMDAGMEMLRDQFKVFAARVLDAMTPPAKRAA
jgi:hypothetical protein